MNYAELSVLGTIFAEEFANRVGGIASDTAQDGTKVFKYVYKGKEAIGLVADDYEEGYASSISKVRDLNTGRTFLLLHNDSRYYVRGASDNVTSLRKAGQLQEAYAEAVGKSRLLYDGWFQTTFFWVLYDLCKDALKGNKGDEARDYLDKMRKLLPTMKDDKGIGASCFERLEEQVHQQEFPEAAIIARANGLAKTDPKAAYDMVKDYISSPEKADTSFHENLGWILYRYMKDIGDTEPSSRLGTLIQCYLKFKNERPSLLHSLMLLAVVKVADKHDELRFHDFFKLWDSENLREEDWQKGADDLGNTYRSLAAKAIHLCYESIERSHDYQDKATTEWIAALYDVLLTKEGDDEWLERDRAKIHLWQGQKEEAINIYKNLLLELSDKYYIWDELAELTDDPDLRIGLLSKALSVERNEAYLGGIRLKLSEMLIEKGLLSEALFELKTYRKSRDDNKQNVSHKYIEQTRRIGQEVQPTANNDSLYARYGDKADDFVFSSMPSTVLTLVKRYKNSAGKRRCALVGNDTDISLSANAFPLLSNSPLGKAFKARLYKKQERDVILTLQATDDDLWKNISSGFGYVEYINEDKNVLHIATTDSELIFAPRRNAKGKIKKGCFVSFRYYKTNHGMAIVNVKEEDRSIVLPYFNETIVAVNNVNNTKGLFGFTLGEGKQGGCIRFEDTSLRPSQGQCLKIHYYIRENKKGGKTVVALDQEETNETNPEAVRTVQGMLKVEWDEYDGVDYHKVPRYGIIYTKQSNKTYKVRGPLLAKHGITDDCYVKAKVVYCGHGIYGNWLAIDIEEHD